MGLLMHYIAMFCQNTEIDFGDCFEMQIGNSTTDFAFKALDEWRVAAGQAWSNGVIRATAAITMFEWESVYFGENLWHKRFGVVTNIGVFVFLNDTLKD